MQPVLLLLLIVRASCLVSNDLSYPYGYNDQTMNKEQTTLEDILARAPLQAIGAYSEIVQDFSQSLDYLRSAIEEWAFTYGLEHEYRSFVNESERENADYRTAMRELYPILTEFLGDHMKIENDKKRSLMLAFSRTSALPGNFENRQKSIVEGIIKFYLPLLPGASSSTGNYGNYAGRFMSYPMDSGNYNRGTGEIGRQEYPVNTKPYTEYGGYGGSYTGTQGIGAIYTDYAKGYPSNNGLLPRVNVADSNQWRF